jgi:putative ABC transport system permease protein
MNIMLVSVTERTREIGVRRAVGARRRDILWLFEREAMILTGLGGLAGLIASAVLVAAINLFSPFPALLSPAWMGLSLLVSITVGLVSGAWPAMMAAHLDPAEALRRD